MCCAVVLLCCCSVVDDMTGSLILELFCVLEGTVLGCSDNVEGFLRVLEFPEVLSRSVRLL